ncbi:Uncharacterised protein [Mycobacteroides abscessus subsp. abscessus]|nr:Uncharacterised protein [Mycobacteroides abscessus subsp. abscessus]
MPGTVRHRAVLSPAGHPGEDQPRVPLGALIGSDPDALTYAGAKRIQQHIGLIDQGQQRLGVLLDVQIDQPLAAVEQVGLLSGDGEPARPAHPDDVGTQVRQHHRRMRPRADPAELDHLHARQGACLDASVSHGATLTSQPVGWEVRLQRRGDGR